MDSNSAASGGGFRGAAILCAALLVCLSSLPFFPFLLPQPTGASQEPSASAAAAERPEGVRHVVLFLMDGVGTRVAFRPGSMPYLQARLPKTAHGVGLVSFPTTTPPGIRALVSGHHSLPDAEFPDSPRRRESDSVMRRASAAGLKAFVVGQQDWPAMFAGHGADITTIRYRVPGPDYDADVFAAARAVASGQRGPWDFLAIHFFSTDPLAHLRGTESPEYAERLLKNDERVDKIAAACPPGTAFVLSADHGQSPTGTHGGIDRYTIYVPIVLWGAGIRPGDFGQVPQNEVAPTLAALLGVQPPILSEGEPIFAALDLNPREKALALGRVLEQKRERWLALKQLWPWVSGDPSPAVEAVDQRLKAKDWSGAARIAQAAVTASSNALEDASPVRWYGRFIAAEGLLVLACGLLFLWKEARPWLPGLIVLAVLIGAACLAPVFYPSLWPEMSLLSIAASGAAAAAARWAGYRLPPLPWIVWAGAALGALGLANPSLVDVALWSALVVGILWLRRGPGRKAGTALARWAAAGAGLAAAWTLGAADPVSDSSALRNLLPPPGMPWKPSFFIVADGLVLAALAAAFWVSARRAPPRRRLGLAAAALAPLLLSLAAPGTGLEYHALCWAAALASLAAAFGGAPGPECRGLWLALCAAAFETSLSRSVRPQLLLAVFVCWCLLGEGEPGPPAWDALEIAALSLWGFTFAGFSLDFSRISVSTVYALPGVHSSLILEVASVALSQLCALAAPLLPAAAGRDAGRRLSVLPLLGAFSAGNLFYFWVDRLWESKDLLNLFGDEFIARALWAMVLAWIVALWCAGSWLRGRRRRRSPAPAI